MANEGLDFKSIICKLLVALEGHSNLWAQLEAHQLSGPRGFWFISSPI